MERRRVSELAGLGCILTAYLVQLALQIWVSICAIKMTKISNPSSPYSFCSKCTKIRFEPLGELTTLPRPSSRLRRGNSTVSVHRPPQHKFLALPVAGGPEHQEGGGRGRAGVEGTSALVLSPSDAPACVEGTVVRNRGFATVLLRWMLAGEITAI